jgi:hypothetical protein
MAEVEIGRQRRAIGDQERRDNFCIPLTMDQSKGKEHAQLGLDVLSRLGTTLRDKTQDVGCAEQPRRMRRLLIELAKRDAIDDP